MRTSLVIELNSPDATVVDWASFHPKTGEITAQGHHTALNNLPHASITWVLIPSTEVLFSQCHVPSQQQQRIIQAIPYALEDELISDVESLHFAIAERDKSSQQVTTAIIDDQRMQAYHQWLQQANLTHARLVPSLYALPYDPESWSFFQHADQALMRTAKYQGFCIESDQLSTALTLASTNTALPEKITSYLTLKQSPPTALHSLGVKLVQQDINHRWTLYAQSLAKAADFTLLQGDYTPKKNRSQLLKTWGITLALLGCIVLTAIADQWLQVKKLREQRQQNTTQMVLLYKRAFPQAQRVVNPRVQMEQQLKRIKSQGGTVQGQHFLKILDAVAPLLARAPNMQLRRLEYRQQRLLVEFNVASLHALEQIKQGIHSQGLQVKVDNASSQNNRVETRLQIY